MSKLDEMLASRQAPGLRGVARDNHKDLRDVSGNIREMLKREDEAGHFNTPQKKRWAEMMKKKAEVYDVTHPKADYQVDGNPWKDHEHIE